MKNKLSVRRALFMLTPSLILHSIGMDIFISCLQMMRNDLMANHNLIQLTLTVFVFGTGLGQLFVGPLSDRYGRRPIMLVSIVIFVLSSMLCAFSPNIHILIFARAIQGIASCGTTVACLAIIRDSFDNKTAPKIYSYLNGAIALAPMVAPILGGELSLYYNSWRSVFHFLTLFASASLIISYFLLAESNDNKKTRIDIVNIGKNYLEILTNRQFITFVLCATTALTGLFTFFSVSQDIFIRQLELSMRFFNLLFGCNAITFMLACIIAVKVQEKFSLKNNVILGSLIIVAGSAIMVIWFKLTGGSTVANLMIPMLLITIGVALSFGPCTALAMRPFKHIAGSASAAYGTIEYCLSSILGGVAIWIGSDISNLNLGYLMLALGIMNIIIIFLLPRNT